MPEPVLSEPRHSVRVERNVPIKMRDGVILRADVHRPEAEGRYPVIVERVAYELVGRCTSNGEFFASRGYVFVGQNVRGTFASEGEWRPFRDDGWGANRDGYDTIEWAGVQPWSNGQVGMADGSYSGFSQYMVAPTRPPHLKALYVRQGGADYYSGFWYRYGAYSLPFQKWAMQTLLAQMKHKSAPPGLESATARLAAALDEYEDWQQHLPLKSFPPLEGLLDWYFEDLDHPADGPYWWPTNITSKFGDIDTPMLHFGAWFDVFLDGTLQSFEGIRKNGRTPACREGQRLLIGPWIHGPGNAAKRVVGDLDFGPQAVFDMNAHRLQWYDYWLKGMDNGMMDGPPVRIFLMGKNEWLDLDDWPPPGITFRSAYFREGSGRDETSLNNGGLTFDPPNAAERPDSFAYNPGDPMPGLRFYPTLGPVDHRHLEGGMLTYTSSELKRDLTVIGPVRAILHGLSSAPDTDWVVRLCDVWPDGRSMPVCDGILRARFRNSLQHPELLTPGKIYRFEIDMSATAQVFQSGHRLRIEITSSDFPRYDRNLNTGGPFGEEATGQTAVNTVFLDADRPSYVILPVVED